MSSPTVKEAIEAADRYWLRVISEARPEPERPPRIIAQDPHWLSFERGFRAGVEATKAEILRGRE